MNLVTLSEEKIAKFGEITSLVFQEEVYTNTRIDEMARRLATGLKSLGIGRGDNVVVSMPNSPEVFACFGAIWRLGAVIVPIMFLMGEEETRYILDHSDAKAIITSNDLLDNHHPGHRCRRLRLVRRCDAGEERGVRRGCQQQYASGAGPGSGGPDRPFNGRRT